MFLKLPDLSVCALEHSYNLQSELDTLEASCNNACSKYQQQSILYITWTLITQTQMRKHKIHMTLKCLDVEIKIKSLSTADYKQIKAVVKRVKVLPYKYLP
jgi:peptidase E